MQDLLTDLGMRIYIILAPISVAAYTWWKKVTKEKNELVAKVAGLDSRIGGMEKTICSLEKKINTESVERKADLRKAEERHDTMMVILNEVRVNTAVNSAKLEK